MMVAAEFIHNSTETICLTIYIEMHWEELYHVARQRPKTQYFRSVMVTMCPPVIWQEQAKKKKKVYYIWVT